MSTASGCSLKCQQHIFRVPEICLQGLHPQHRTLSFWKVRQLYELEPLNYWIGRISACIEKTDREKAAPSYCSIQHLTCQDSKQYILLEIYSIEKQDMSAFTVYHKSVTNLKLAGICKMHPSHSVYTHKNLHSSSACCCLMVLCCNLHQKWVNMFHFSQCSTTVF